MQHKLTKLQQALADPADGPYALGRLRELLIDALEHWPSQRYAIADLYLPHGKPVTGKARRMIDGLICMIEGNPTSEDEILDLALAMELVCW